MHVAYVMRVAGLTGVQLGGGPDPTGLLVQEYDPDGNQGRGDVALTRDLQEARKFGDLEVLFRTWTATSVVRPVRADGRPNRPLTAYTVEPVLVRWCRTSGRWLLGEESAGG